MRIVHFLNHTQRSNGHVHVAIDLACSQAKMGHAVTVISGGGDFDLILAEYNVHHLIIDQSRRVFNLVSAIRKLNAAIGSIKPDIIHAHMMTSAGLSYVLKPFRRFKLVTTVHNEFERSAIVMGLGDAVVAVSEAVKESMIRRGVSKTKLHVILNGTIGSPRLSAMPPAPEILERPSISFVGGLHPRKGVNDLIAAVRIFAARVPTAHLYIVGAGPHQDEYEAQAAQTGFGNRITFCGYQTDPRRYLLASDVFVLPSHSEPAGLVLTEAREAGCAIIGSSVGGIPEMLDNGEAGLLVPPHRPNLLGEAILDLIGDPTKLAAWKKRAGQNLARFTVQRACEDYLELYGSLVA